MCPDKQMLSMYVDNELPSPWKEKLEAHLSGCPECKKQTERYAAFSRFADGAAMAAGREAAKARVWEALSRRGVPAVLSAPESKPAWRRTVRLPLPFAVAAAAVFAAALAAFLLPARRVAEPAAPWIAPAAPRGALDIPALEPFEFDAQAAGTLSSMSDILSLIEADDSTNVVIIKLPEKKNYNRSGGPLLLRAVDYDNQAPAGGRAR